MVTRARDPDPLRRSGGADDLPELPGEMRKLIGAEFPLSEYRKIRDHCIRRTIPMAKFVRQAVREKMSADDNHRS